MQTIFSPSTFREYQSCWYIKPARDSHVAGRIYKWRVCWSVDTSLARCVTVNRSYVNIANGPQPRAAENWLPASRTF